MKNAIKTITAARADFADLEILGWDFSDIYEGVAAAQGMTIDAAEKWEKENYHILITVEADGSTYYQPCHNTNGNEGDRQETGDDNQTRRDLSDLYDARKLWSVEFA